MRRRRATVQWRHLVNWREAARCGEWAQHFSNASCLTSERGSSADAEIARDMRAVGCRRRAKLYILRYLTGCSGRIRDQIIIKDPSRLRNAGSQDLSCHVSIYTFYCTAEYTSD